MRKKLILCNCAKSVPCAYPPLFAYKPLRKVCALLLMLCVSVVSWAATRYCGETINTSQEEITVTVKKTGELETTFIFESEKLANREEWQGLNPINLGSGTLSGADFSASTAKAYTSGKLTCVTTWSSYLTGSMEIYFSLYRDQVTYGGSDIMTFTLSNIDASATCGSAGSEVVAFDPATIDWTSSENTSTYHKVNEQFQIAAENASNMPSGPLNIQRPDWAAFEGLYVEVPAGVSACAFDDVAVTDGTEYDGNTGAGIVLNPTALVNAITKVTVTHGSGTTIFYVHNANTGGGGDGETPTGICASKTYASNVEGYAILAKVSKGCNKYYLTLTSATEGKTLAGIVGDNFFCNRYSDEGRTHVNGYHMAISGRYTISEGAIVFTIPSVGDPQMYTDMQVKFSDNQEVVISALNGVRLQPCSSESAAVCPDPAPSEINDVNFALQSQGAIAYASSGDPWQAIDGNNGSRWESTHGIDPQWYIVDLGQRRIFNTIQICWETAYATSFTIDVSDDGESWINKVTEAAYSEGGNNVEYKIDLGEDVTARYIRFNGTARATSYGYSFYEFRVIKATTPVLTTYTASMPSMFCTIGTDYQVSIVSKDQLGNDFPISTTFSVTPATAGTITATGVYTPEQQGDATITVSGGGKEATINVRNEVSANLALNKAATSGHDAGEGYSKDKANNSNLGDRWASGEAAVHYANGANPDFQDWWYVDLGNEAIYDIAEIAIKWETACPNDYDIRVSADAENWTTIETYNTYPVSSGDGSSNYQFYNNFSNSVPCRYVGVWAREGFGTPSLQYGISMFDFQVFGLEHVDAGVKVESITLNHTSATIELGESLTLTASVAPVNATDKSITWSSDAESVATVVDGVITTHTAGTARITATANDGSGVSATCELTVVPVTAKTWWGTQTITDWDPDMDVMWSVTRNANKTLTYTVYFGGDASGKVMQVHDKIGGSEHWNNLTGYTDADRRVSFTTETTHEKGTTIPDHFIYFGGPRIELADYVVGSENERPSSSVESVEISHAAATVVKDETLQLSATVLPSFVENKSITWSSDNETVASVSNTGLVTGKAAGEAVITATSAADGTKKATCTITVTAELAPATWYGVGTFTNFVESKDAFAYEYSFTRATNHNVTLDVVFSEDMTLYISPDDNFGIYINDAGNHLTYDATTKTATYDFGSRADGDNITWRFYFVMANGVHETSNAVYTVGSSNEKVYACVVDEDVDNADVLEEYKGRTAQVIVDRSFAADNLYTLVLPFNVDAAMRAEKLPGQLTRLNNTIAKENGDLRINFVDAEAVEAGVPYLYTPSADVANPVFTGVTVSNDLRPTVPADGYAKYYGIYAPLDATALHGIENGYVLGGDRYLYSTSSLVNTQKMNALRGYFVLKFPTGGGANGAPRARVIFNSHETETTTDVSHVQDDNVPCTKVIRDGQLLIMKGNRTYNAQGQLIK